MSQKWELSKRRVVGGAERLADRHIPAFDRLAALTPIAANRGQPQYVFVTSDREMSPRIYANGGYDTAEMSWALDYLGQPQRSGLVVEVGANIGTTTVPLLTRHGASAVEAFEPAPLNFKLLWCNLILNEVETRAAITQVAISDQDAELVMELCDWNTGDNRIAAANPQGEKMWESTRPRIHVPALRLDRALAAPVEKVSLVWVDTQGHEAQVLAGASALLAAKVPWIIEYWPYGLARAGGAERLHRLIADHFTGAVDVRRSMDSNRPVLIGPEEVATMSQRPGLCPPGLEHDWYTDLILLP
ncbi:MAG TPA: FkbM family methyltransferase [Acidimicrobiales bacterium]|nr:FkbM family methyltransferase [Acidimicrobiales bacterium]